MKVYRFSHPRGGGVRFISVPVVRVTKTTVWVRHKGKDVVVYRAGLERGGRSSAKIGTVALVHASPAAPAGALVPRYVTFYSEKYVTEWQDAAREEGDFVPRVEAAS